MQVTLLHHILQAGPMPVPFHAWSRYNVPNMTAEQHNDYVRFIRQFITHYETHVLYGSPSGWIAIIPLKIAGLLNYRINILD